MDKTWSSGKLTGRFWPRDDARGVWLGQYTNCCQHPKHTAGNTCAWYGQEKPNSGFFVVEDAEHNIIAQSWVWINDEGAVGFDNVEGGVNQIKAAEGDVQSVYQQVGDFLQPNHHAVTIGTTTSDLNLSLWKDADALKLPSDYSGHTDASKQRLSAHNPDVPKTKTLPEVYVRGGLESDLPAAQAIARQVYPADWQFIPKGFDHALVLTTKDNQALGYATIETKNRYISDLAVLPEHRVKAPLLLKALAVYMKKYPGPWTATCRNSTSYKLLKRSETRGMLTIESARQSGEMDGEPMHHVSFTLK